MAKKLISIFLLCLMSACTASRGPMVTYAEFSQVQTGSTVASIEETLGAPYAIHDKSDGTKEYEYIERIDGGSGVIAENHYFFIIENGKVVGKYVKREQAPAYDLIYQDEPNYN